MTLKTVCVVEDEPALQEAIKLKLSKAGVQVLTASSGEEALKVVAANRLDLLWLDVLLPGMNGLEVLRTVRKNPAWVELPVVIASVSAGPEKIKEAFSLGVVDYLVKSEYTIDQLIAKALDILAQLEAKGEQKHG